MTRNSLQIELKGNDCHKIELRDWTYFVKEAEGQTLSILSGSSSWRCVGDELFAQGLKCTCQRQITVAKVWRER